MLKTSAAFVPADCSSSGEPPRHLYFGIQSDLGLFNVCTSRPLVMYLHLKFKDCGIAISESPFVLNLDLVKIDTWTACVVNPETHKVLYAINHVDRFTMQTVCAMLSFQFPRHELRLNKLCQTRMAYRNGVVVKDTVEFNSCHRQPHDWI